MSVPQNVVMDLNNVLYEYIPNTLFLTCDFSLPFLLPLYTPWVFMISVRNTYGVGELERGGGARE